MPLIVLHTHFVESFLMWDGCKQGISLVERQNSFYLLTCVWYLLYSNSFMSYVHTFTIMYFCFHIFHHFQLVYCYISTQPIQQYSNSILLQLFNLNPSPPHITKTMISFWTAIQHLTDSPASALSFIFISVTFTHLFFHHVYSRSFQRTQPALVSRLIMPPGRTPHW